MPPLKVCVVSKNLSYIRLLGISCALLLAAIPSNAQYQSLFTEDFEGCGVGTLPICSWTDTGTGSRWTTANGLCTINGLYSLAVGSDATFCEYNRDFGFSDRIAFYQIDASGFQQLDITFEWRCLGETGLDFGTVVYSNDGVSWNDVSLTQYQGSIGAQSEISLPLPDTLSNDPTAFIGFRWVDNPSNGGWPGFVIDDINIMGEQMVPPDPSTPVSGVPLGCDSVELSWGGLPPSPSNVVWYWQDSVCGTDTNIISGSDTNFTVYSTGTYYIRAYNTVSGLWSVNCDSITVTVDGPPPVADAGASGAECDLNYVFSATPSVGAGQWSLVTGPGTAIFNDTVSPNDTVTVSMYGTYVFMWTEVNGACTDNDTVTVSFFQQPMANAGFGGNECDLDFTLVAQASAGTGMWTQLSGPLGTSFQPPTSPVSVADVTVYGTYIYQWTETNGVCSDSSTVTVTYSVLPVADAGIGGIECDLDFILNATPSITGGYWSQLSGIGTSTFVDSMNPNTTVTVSQEGTYTYRWTEGSGVCLDFADITVIYSLLNTANAGPDTSVSLGNSVELDGQGGFVYLWSSNISPLTLNDSTLPDPIASPLVSTTYYMTITDANNCTDRDTVVVEVLVDFNFIVSNIMTPNGDGFNDMWYIDNIEFYPECDVAIYNRYGNQLYSVTGYNNDWDGKHNGKDLPDGTYYYVLKCPGTSDIFKGGITIFRRK